MTCSLIFISFNNTLFYMTDYVVVVGTLSFFLLLTFKYKYSNNVIFKINLPLDLKCDI